MRMLMSLPSQLRVITDSLFHRYYSGNAAANPARGPLNKIFDSYRENAAVEPDEIGIDGTMKMLGQLQIEPDDVAALVFSEIVASPSLGKMTREGFVDGWSELSVDSLPKMRNVVLQRRSELSTNAELFKNVYTHTFQLALQPGSKTLPIEMAVEFWRTLFVSPGFNWRTQNSPWLDWWLEFQNATRTKAVNKDLWKQTLAFARETVRDDTLSFWSDESSWPSVVDEFVAWVREEKHAGGAPGQDAMAVDER